MTTDATALNLATRTLDAHTASLSSDRTVARRGLSLAMHVTENASRFSAELVSSATAYLAAFDNAAMTDLVLAHHALKLASAVSL
jgi:hypothetical protein